MMDDPNALAKAKMMLQKQQRDKAEADWPRPRITPGCSMAPLPHKMCTCSVSIFWALSEVDMRHWLNLRGSEHVTSAQGH